jgi:hypothetical protein
MADQNLKELLKTAACYPNVLQALQILLVFPATTVEAERSFSTMKRVKTWQRTSMTSERLSDICTIHCNRNRLDEDVLTYVLRVMTGPNRRMKF